MRLSMNLASLTALCVALAACGDDTGPTDGGNGGEGGTPSDGGTGAGANDGAGGTGAEGGGGAPPVLKAVGESCGANEDCDGGLCLTEDFFGWAAGYCSALCDPDLAPCEAGSECIAATNSASVCLKLCDGSGDCPGVANECIDIGQKEPLQICIGGCTEDAQCAEACDNDNLVCTPAGEVCTGGTDEDGDGLHDCQELDCATDCADEIAAACAGDNVLTPGTEIEASTADGVDIFTGTCLSFFGPFTVGGGKEQVYTYTAASGGVLTLTATAVAGDLGIYVRTTCADGTTQDLNNCADNAIDPGEDEVLEVTVAQGDVVTVFVDAYNTEGEGDFLLNAEFLAQVCGDGEIIGTEECDDNNTTPGDGCSATCTVELDFLCDNADPVLVAVPVVGDTTTGTAGFVGCAGNGNELIYQYTPLTSGTVTITATPTETSILDTVLYVRTDCESDASEVDCVDVGLDGDPETVDVDVTANTPIWIFVDSYYTDGPGAFTLTVNPAD